MMKKIIFSFLIVGIIVTTSFFLLFKKEEVIETENNLFLEHKIDPVKKIKEKALSELTSKLLINAKQAIIIDSSTGVVLFEKNADERMTPSSMTKMMTSYLIEDKILKGQLNLEQEFFVSEKAWRMQGSKMFVPLGQKVKVLDLLKGVIIQSGNDACIVLAEGVAGSEINFADQMNDMAKKMGLTNTHFKNASGWPEEGHYSTARDLAILGLRVVNDHPDFYKIYSEKTFTYNNISQGNRNPLLYDNLNCDGIKTGHTDDGGYGMVASFLDGEQRYIMVINGLLSMNARAEEAKRLLSLTKENFYNKEIFKKDEALEEKILVKWGKKNEVGVLAGADIKMLMPRYDQKRSIKIIPKENLTAPIKQGQIIGKLEIKTAIGISEFPIKASEDIEKMGYFKRVAKQMVAGVFGEK